METTAKIPDEYIKNEEFIINKQGNSFIQSFNLLSSMAIGSFYVLDIQEKRFRYVKPDSLFLCNYSVEDAMNMGFDFYSKIIHPEDISLWTNMLKIIFQYGDIIMDKREDIDHFFCTCRLQLGYLSQALDPLPQMVYQRMKPIWINNQLQYLFCFVASSTIKEAGNLRLYYKDKSIYEEYSFMTKRWSLKFQKSLTEREKAILILARQGESSREIADRLCKGLNTIRNQTKALFSKLEVHSIQEAIEVTLHHNML